MKVYQVDSFTSRPFEGNPAGVCLLTHELEDSLLQSLAREMNLSETAFLLPKGEEWSLRWFTPQVEVDLCGHATLAAAHVLSHEEDNPRSTYVFHTRSGRLGVSPRDNHSYSMDFPARYVEPTECPPLLEKALGTRPMECYSDSKRYLLIFESEEDIQSLDPHFDLLASFPRGIMVSAASPREDLDFVSRFFAPCVGINEDPVTGSSHCYLAPFWGKRLGKTHFQARQLSSRGGHVGCTVLPGDRVELLGQAVTVFRGEWTIL